MAYILKYSKASEKSETWIHLVQMLFHFKHLHVIYFSKYCVFVYIHTHTHTLPGFLLAVRNFHLAGKCNLKLSYYEPLLVKQNLFHRNLFWHLFKSCPVLLAVGCILTFKLSKSSFQYLYCQWGKKACILDDLRIMIKVLKSRKICIQSTWKVSWANTSL